MNIVTVTRPELTPEERAKRMEKIKEAVVRLVQETEKQKKQKGKTLWSTGITGAEKR